MNYLVDAKCMKEIDDRTIHEIHIPALILMERAALAVVSVMKQEISFEDRILLVCGSGNNGGDGIAIGRILFLQGYDVVIHFIGDQEKASRETQEQLTIAKNLNMKIVTSSITEEYTIIVDAIFGIGLARSIEGEYKNIIQQINNAMAKVFAVDIPSGISANDGKVMNVAVKAHHTITFGLQKIGLVLYPGAEYAGQVTVADIGFPNLIMKEVAKNIFTFDQNDLVRLPIRKPYSNKGSFGKVLVIAGKEGMSGAAYLSAKAAYKTGAGLVKVLTSKENRIILQTSIPEALYEPYDSDIMNQGEKDDRIRKTLQWADVIVIGPGLGCSEQAVKLLTLTMKEAKVPTIIDADGLNILAETMNQEGIMDPMRRCTMLESLCKINTILTPHLKELSRLLNVSVEEIRDNIIDTAKHCSYNNDIIYAIKDARTIIAQRSKLYLNRSGNQGMATGGSGDVLTGIIAGLIAQGMDSYEATCLAVYIHGLSGDKALEKKGAYSLMASDLLETIVQVLKN